MKAKLWSAKLITSEHENNKAVPVYWSLNHNDKTQVRLTINVYGADRITLDAAKLQVKELLNKLNS